MLRPSILSSQVYLISFEFDKSKPDAKDFVEIHQLNSQANSLVTSGQHDKAEIVCEKMKKLLPEPSSTRVIIIQWPRR